MDEHRAVREQELRRRLSDPVERIVLEREFFEAFKLLPPDKDEHFIRAIMEYDDAGIG